MSAKYTLKRLQYLHTILKNLSFQQNHCLQRTFVFGQNYIQTNCNEVYENKITTSKYIKQNNLVILIDLNDDRQLRRKRAIPSFD